MTKSTFVKDAKNTKNYRVNIDKDLIEMECKNKITNIFKNWYQQSVNCNACKKNKWFIATRTIYIRKIGFYVQTTWQMIRLIGVSLYYDSLIVFLI